MGAKVQGAGTEVITVDGVQSLHSTTYTIPADRIEAGTSLVATAITGGKIKINSIQPDRPIRLNRINFNFTASNCSSY